MTRLILMAFSYLAMTVCNNTNPTINPENEKQADSLTIEFNDITKNGVFNGFAVSIVNEKGTLYQKGFGFADIKNRKKYTDSTIQNIASISKTFIGVALIKAQELGKLKLDDPINKYLPFKVFNPNFINTEITIRHLATHTSSIADNDYYTSKDFYLKENQDLNGMDLRFYNKLVFNQADSIISLEDFLRNLLSEKGKWRTKDSYFKYKPGTIFEYSNTGATLAAFIIENATGEQFDKFTTKHILKPLKMTASGWDFKDVNIKNYSRLYKDANTLLPYYRMITYPDGNFITSVNDLSLYLSEFIKGYNGNGTILSKQSYKVLFTPQLEAKNFIERDDKNPYNDEYNMSIFIGFGPTGYIGHTGGDPGVVTYMFFNPKNNLGRIMIFNTNISDSTGNNTFNKIWDVLEKYQTKFTN